MTRALKQASLSQQLIILFTLALMMWFVGKFFISSLKSLAFIVLGILFILLTVIILNSLA
ncbi:MAG: hypothetical protein GXN99_02795 [Candidatus Nanohaloarchaeota archaeon]|nr:hypothetical protein [Candidatus Nanohaloarchaeota archaeon]